MSKTRSRSLVSAAVIMAMIAGTFAMPVLFEDCGVNAASSVTVKFKANGGKLVKFKYKNTAGKKVNKTMKSKKVTKGKKAGTLAKAKRDGYVFKGWYTKKKKGKKVTAKTKIKKNTTLYARWTVDKNAVPKSLTNKLGKSKSTLKDVMAIPKTYTSTDGSDITYRSEDPVTKERIWSGNESIAQEASTSENKGLKTGSFDKYAKNPRYVERSKVPFTKWSDYEYNYNGYTEELWGGYTMTDANGNMFYYTAERFSWLHTERINTLSYDLRNDKLISIYGVKQEIFPNAKGNVTKKTLDKKYGKGVFISKSRNMSYYDATGKLKANPTVARTTYTYEYKVNGKYLFATFENNKNFINGTLASKDHKTYNYAWSVEE